MKKIIILLLIGMVLMVGCNSEKATLSNDIEQRVIETGEIVNLNEETMTVTIGEEDTENKCIWINSCTVSEEEFETLEIGQEYTIED